MNEKDMLAMLNQCREEGGDLIALLDRLNAAHSEGTTPLGLKRWRADDKPQMADFNRDNEILDREISGVKADNAILEREIDDVKEELEKKANGNWIVYNTLPQLGLENGSETIVGMVAKMRVGSALFLNVASTFNSQEYPITYGGLLTINKAGTGRATVEFSRPDSLDKWYGFSSDIAFTGWAKYATA